MTAISNKILVCFFCALIFLATGCYAYWQEVYFLVIPIVVLAVVLLLQYPSYALYLLMLAVPWSVEFNFNPTLGTDLPDEPLMLLAALSVVILAIRQKKLVQPGKLHPLLFIIGLQFLWAILTTITSTDFVASAKYVLAKGWYLLAFVGLPLFLFREERILRRALVLLLGSMMVVMAVTLIRQASWGWTFERVNDAVHPFFRNHVNYSALLVFMVPLQIAWMQLCSSRKARAFFYVLIAVTMAAVYFSYARGAWLALVTGLLSYWLLRKRWLVFSFFGFLILITATAFWLRSNERFVKFSNDYKSTIYHSDFREHLIATYQLKDLSNAERIYRWIAGVRMIKDSWRTGFGPSTFYHQYKSYTLPAFKTYVSDNREQSTVHNYFLLMLVEQGVWGCLLFVCLLGLLFWYAQTIFFRTNAKFWRVAVAAAASLLMMQCVINFLSDMIETDKVGSVFYLCVATVIVADIKTRKDPSKFSTDIERVS